MGAVVVVIVWQFDLQLPMQSVPITTKVVGSNPTYGEVVLDIDNVIKVASDLRLVSCFLWVFWFTPSIKLTTTILLILLLVYKATDLYCRIVNQYISQVLEI